MVLLFGFAFISGLVTILAPCIWPLLPIVLSTTIAGGAKSHMRPLGITLGIVVSFAFFTLSISFLVQAFHIDQNILRLFAVIVLIILGLTMIIPFLGTKLEEAISRLSGLLGVRPEKGEGFFSGFFAGLVLGVVWSPCAGPILATIATLAATGKVTLDVVLVTISYVVGVGIPLFAFAYGGQQVLTRARGIAKYTGRIQQIFGVVMLLTALAIYTHYDTYIEAQLLNAFPAFSQNLNKFEGNIVVTKELNTLKGNQNISIPQQPQDISGLFNTNYPASDFTGITKWLNTDKPLSLKDLRGKVVLVDFWTYTCINCIRTLPHVTSWYDKYHNQGFVVVGVHTPEFEFEHDTNNVLNAIKMYNIHYPVAQDNNYATWNAYNNEYWPAEYLIDAAGNVRRTEFGEGEYDKTEEAIQVLLQEAGKKVTSKLDSIPDTTPTTQLSPETYVGANRMEYYYPSGNVSTGDQIFTLSQDIPENSFTFGGEWNITGEDAVTGNNAVLQYNFYANKVYLVLRPGTLKNPTVAIFLDNKPVSVANAGMDVVSGKVTLDSDRLYNLIDLHGRVGNHILRLEFNSPGISAFAFTFG